MGGDGGTVSTNRRYLRGAGSASHTADAKRSGGAATDDERERLLQVMTTCTITGATLDLTGVSGDIVACPYGRLYNREAAVQALLRRMESGATASTAEPDIGYHCRGLKDLYPVRFQVIERDGNGSGSGPKYAAVCPLTGVELNGASPAILIVKNKPPKKKKNKDDEKAVPQAAEKSDTSPNVLSERAIREVGIDSLQEEYGPFDMANCIRLAPTVVGGVFDKVKSDLEARRAEEKKSKKDKKKKDKKRSEPGPMNDDTKLPASANGGSSNKKARQDRNATVSGASGGKKSAAEAARANVGAAVASNPALSSLFSSGKTGLTEKERRDALFTTNT